MANPLVTEIPYIGSRNTTFRMSRTFFHYKFLSSNPYIEEPDVQTQNTDPVCWLLMMLKLLSSAASEDAPLLYTEASLAALYRLHCQSLYRNEHPSQAPPCNDVKSIIAPGHRRTGIQKGATGVKAIPCTLISTEMWKSSSCSEEAKHTINYTSGQTAGYYFNFNP